MRAVVGGYGRVGHTVGTIFKSSGVPFIAFDTSPIRVAEFRNQGHPVCYGDISDANLLTAAHLERVGLVVLTIDDQPAILRATTLIRQLAPGAVIVARARDLSASEALLRAGANRAFPETLEASLKLAAEALISVGVAAGDAELLLRGVRNTDYALVREWRQGAAYAGAGREGTRRFGQARAVDMWPFRTERKDARSGRVVFLIECLLNQNARDSGAAESPATTRAVIDLLADKQVGMVQIPCPEIACLGFARKRAGGYKLSQ